MVELFVQMLYYVRSLGEKGRLLEVEYHRLV